MKNFGFFWTIATNIIVLIISFAVFNIADTRFEKVVISLLVMIYLNITAFTGLWGQNVANTTIAYDYEFKRIRKLLKDQISEDEEEQIAEAKKKIENATTKFWINSIFTFAIYLITVFNLLGAL